MESNVTYDQWNLAIAEMVYTRSNSGRPTYLQVDDQMLSKIGCDLGLTASVSRSNFIRAVRSRAALDRMPLEKFFQCRLWESDTSKPPPFIGFLAFCVLAAFDMERNSSKGVSTTNYYARFEELLGAKRPQKFYDVHQLWERLNKWLDEDLKGMLGQSTARYVNHKHVGYPISQALLRQTDRNKLPLFYERCGLQPNEQNVSSDFIYKELLGWSKLSTFPFDQRFQRIFEQESNGTVHEVAKMVLAEYEVWDGRTADEIRDGVISAEIILQLEPDYDICHLTLFPPAQSRNGTPLLEGHYKDKQQLHKLEYDPFSNAWFTPLSNVPFLQQAIAGNNIELVYKQHKLYFKARQFFLFQPDDGELGHWVHTNSRPELNTRYHLLCHPEQAKSLHNYLNGCATISNSITLTNPLLKQWVWLRDVTFLTIPTVTDELFQSIVPKHPQNTVKLLNGLKLGRNRYLQGGEPTIIVNNLSQPTTLHINDMACGELGYNNNSVELTQYNLSVGTHQIRVGQEGAQRHIYIVGSGHQLERYEPLGAVFTQVDNGMELHGFALSTTPDAMVAAEIFISGANIKGGDQVSLDIVHPVWVSCGNYTRCIIIGRNPHQIIEHRLPRSNHKLNIIFPVMFKPQWVLYAQGNKCRVSPVGTPLSPIKPDETHENHRHWAKWIRNAKPPRKNQMWKTYCKVAKSIR